MNVPGSHTLVPVGPFLWLQSPRDAQEPWLGGPAQLLPGSDPEAQPSLTPAVALLSHLTPPSPHCPTSSAITTFSGFAPQMPWTPPSAWAPLPRMVPTHCPLGEARVRPTLLRSRSSLPPHCVALSSLSVSPPLKGLMGTSCRQMVANVLLWWPHWAGGLQGQAEAGGPQHGAPHAPEQQP